MPRSTKIVRTAVRVQSTAIEEASGRSAVAAPAVGAGPASGDGEERGEQGGSGDHSAT